MLNIKNIHLNEIQNVIKSDKLQTQGNERCEFEKKGDRRKQVRDSFIHLSSKVQQPSEPTMEVVKARTRNKEANEKPFASQIFKCSHGNHDCFQLTTLTHRVVRG